MDSFDFKVNSNMMFGIGFSRNLGSFLQQKGYRNALLMVDEGVIKNSSYYREVVDAAGQYLDKLNILTLRGTEEPDYDYLDEIADKARSFSDVDILIGIGGGSCLDITKAVAVLKTNPGKGIEYRGFDLVLNPGIPTVAIPSTAGTGSEATINAVFIDKKERKKLGINGRYMNATFAILDSEWTASCPSLVAVSSGMDAMTHTLESFSCRKANLLTRIFSKAAFRLLYFALPSIVNDPANREKQQEILLGSYLAGIALFNSGSGIAGAFSYPIGVHFKVPHGICGGIFLNSVIDFNIERDYGGYAELYDVIEHNPNLSQIEKAKYFSEKMKVLSSCLKVPQYLDQWGITKGNTDEVSKLMLPLQAAFDQNPVPFSADEDAHEMLKKHVKP